LCRTARASASIFAKAASCAARHSSGDAPAPTTALSLIARFSCWLMAQGCDAMSWSSHVDPQRAQASTT
jgi:hypothetical protein